MEKDIIEIKKSDLQGLFKILPTTHKSVRNK